MINSSVEEVMDKVADILENAYLEFVISTADVVETKASTNGETTPATDAALENLKKKLEAFNVACDQADEFVDFVRESIIANNNMPVNQDTIDKDHVADNVVDCDD